MSRPWDPFSPPDPAPPPSPAASRGDDLDDLTKMELVDRAEDAGLPMWGTKQQLIDRLRSR